MTPTPAKHGSHPRRSPGLAVPIDTRIPALYVRGLPGCVRPGHDGSVTTVVLFGGVVSLVGVTVWIGLLIWAAKGDGRVQ